MYIRLAKPGGGGTWGAGASQFLGQNFGNTDRHLIVGKKFKHSVIYLDGL